MSNPLSNETPKVQGSKLIIFEYLNYRLYLQDYYKQQKDTTRYFSYRYFSQKAGFSSHNVLKQVINGQRNISVESIHKFCKALNLNTQEAEYFRLLVLFCQVKEEKEKNELFKKLIKFKQGSSAKRYTEKQYEINTEWYYIALREVITLRDFRDEYEEIGRLLRPSISASQVRKALLALEEVGLVRKGERGQWEVCDQFVETPAEINKMNIRNHNKKMIEIALEAITRFEPKDREISSMTLGVSQETYFKIKQRIQDFKQNLISEISADTSQSDVVCQLNFQLFPLINIDDGFGGGNNDASK